MACLAKAGWATTSTPPTTAPPAVGTTRVVSMPTVVVLPAPLGPSRPKISPWPMDRSRRATGGSPTSRSGSGRRPTSPRRARATSTASSHGSPTRRAKGSCSLGHQAGGLVAGAGKRVAGQHLHRRLDAELVLHRLPAATGHLGGVACARPFDPHDEGRLLDARLHDLVLEVAAGH